MRSVTCLLLDASDFVDPNGPREQANLVPAAMEASLDTHLAIDDKGSVMFNRSGRVGEIGCGKAA